MALAFYFDAFFFTRTGVHFTRAGDQSQCGCAECQADHRCVGEAGAHTVREIAALLNARSIATARGGKWHVSAVQGVSPAYKRNGGEGTSHPPFFRI